MQQIRLKSLVAKLSLVSIYLLFLSVQLNLKYTFSDSIFYDYSRPISDQKAGIVLTGVEKSQDGKSAVQKLRLNKRYVHQEVFLISSLVVAGLNRYFVKVTETFPPVPRISGMSVCRALLRGPPHSATFYV
jgi:hypothetical protein